MFDKNHLLAFKIKNILLANFPNVDVNVFLDKERNEYFISTRNKEHYYSEEYGKLIFEINQDLLWGQGIFNFFFILDESEKENDKLANVISFTVNNEIRYISWFVNKSHTLLIDKHNNEDNYSLAA